MKAIETVYRGYRFRSRLEARWAVFFDALGLEWEYEPEGFQIGNSYYLPDFRILNYKRKCPLYIEVKPRGKGYGDETKIILAFAWELWDNNGGCAIVVYGDPAGCDFYYPAISDGGFGEIFGDSRQGVKFIFNPKKYGIKKLKSAAVSARQARFEHGQVGAPSEW